MSTVLPFRRKAQPERPWPLRRANGEQPPSKPSELRPFWLRGKPNGIKKAPRGSHPLIRYLRNFETAESIGDRYLQLISSIAGSAAGFSPLMVPGSFRLERLERFFADCGYRLESRRGIPHVVPIDGNDPEVA